MLLACMLILTFSAAAHALHAPALHASALRSTVPARLPSLVASAASPRSAGRRAAVGALGLALAQAGGGVARAESNTPWAYSTLVEQIETDGISSVQILPEAKKVVATDKGGRLYETQVIDASDLLDRLRKSKVRYEVVDEATNAVPPLVEFFIGLLPPLVLFAGLMFLLRPGGGPTNGAGRGGPMAIGKMAKEIVLEPR